MAFKQNGTVNAMPRAPVLSQPISKGLGTVWNKQTSGMRGFFLEATREFLKRAFPVACTISTYSNLPRAIYFLQHMLSFMKLYIVLISLLLGAVASVSTTPLIGEEMAKFVVLAGGYATYGASW